MSEGANRVSDRVEWCRRWESNPHETCASRDFEGCSTRWLAEFVAHPLHKTAKGPGGEFPGLRALDGCDFKTSC
jgi:hypothetical protein